MYSLYMFQIQFLCQICKYFLQFVAYSSSVNSRLLCFLRLPLSTQRACWTLPRLLLGFPPFLTLFRSTLQASSMGPTVFVFHFSGITVFYCLMSIVLKSTLLPVFYFLSAWKVNMISGTPCQLGMKSPSPPFPWPNLSRTLGTPVVSNQCLTIPSFLKFLNRKREGNGG